jgi:heptosyltransferase-1
LRALKKAWWSPRQWANLFDDKAALQREKYDLVIDTQGLLKSALVAGWAHGELCGYAADSAREPFASRLYRRTHSVSKAMHAVERNRTLGALAARIAAPAVCDYGVTSAPSGSTTGTFSPRNKEVVFLHGTSRVEKEWPVASWIELGERLNQKGFSVALVAGSAREQTRSQQIAASLASASILPTVGLDQVARRLADAFAVIGVDTGLAHLAVAMGTPTIGVYRATDPARTGLHPGLSGRCVNVGGNQHLPSVDEVEAALNEVTD